MRPVIPEVPVVIELASSGVATGITWDQVDGVSFAAPVAGGTSDIANIRLRFPSNFNEDSLINGLFKPRFWMESMPNKSNVLWQYKKKLQSALGAGDFGNADIAGTEIPHGYQELENFDKATYYVTAQDVLSTLQVQLKTSATAPARDTGLTDPKDPNLAFEFDRQSTPQLSPEFPNSNSMHLFIYSEVEIYINSWIDSVTGQRVNQRYLLGWCPDDKFSAPLDKDKVEAVKGKPSATIVTFYSKIKSKISGEIITMDPWLMERAFGITAQRVNGKIRFVETNKQRPVPDVDCTMEWFTSSGHLVSLRIPVANFDFTNPFTPGADAISGSMFSLTTKVNPTTRRCWQMDISESPVQRSLLEIAYAIA